MEHLKIITTNLNKTEGTISINTGVPGFPFIEVCQDGKWVPVTNLKSRDRMARFDDLYTYMRAIDWGVGPRIYESTSGNLYMDPTPKTSSIPVLGSSGFRVSELVATEDILKIDNICMNKEVDLYYDYLVSSRDLLEKSSVIDLFTYPTEYGNTINLSNLPGDNIIKLGVAYSKDGLKYTEELMFSPKSDDGNWLEFTQSLGGNVLVEFHDGCIRLFPENSNVTECIIHHCVSFYEHLL